MRATRSSFGQGLRFIAPLVLLWLVPVVALCVLVPVTLTREGESVTTALPATATVGSRENNHRQSVTATFTVTEPQDVLLPGDGLVTAVHAVVGQNLVSSDAVVSVDGAILRAHVDAQPFYRDIEPGTRGSDLDQLQLFLDTNGITAQLGRDSSFSSSLTRGIRSYQKTNGFPEDGIFRPSYVVYVPPEATEVQSVLVAVGALVTAGEPVLAGPVRPVSLTLSADSPLKLAGKEGPFAAVVLDHDVTLSSLVPPPEDVVALHGALIDAAARGGPTMTVEGSTQSFTGVMLYLPSAVARGTVPNTAVHTADSGTQCVFLVPDHDGTSETAPPETATAAATPISDAAPVDGEIGLASVQAELIGLTVVRDPQTLPSTTLGGCA